MSKDLNEKLTQVGLESYYEILGRGDRGRLLIFIASYLNISYYSVQNKFVGRTKFSVAELIALQPVINQELWRQ